MINIDQLPPGPELDRMIAVEVMGWKFYSEPDYFSDDNGRMRKTSLYHGKDPEQVEFMPSTNIAHTWEVVDKIKSLLDIPVDRYGLNNSPVFTLRHLGDTWSASFVRDPYDPWEHEGEHQSVSMAICLCGLKVARRR